MQYSTHLFNKKKLKFAVVREDPIIEQELIQQIQPQNALMVASGGCTALTLKTIFPEIDFTLFDISAEQIEHVKRKITALSQGDNPSFYNTFCIGKDNKNGLNGCGEFESLFRSFRYFIHEFIIQKKELEAIFLSQENKKMLLDKLLNNKYWPIAFDLYFSDSMLITMFGPDAVQHAKPGSYPRYFQKVIEHGLSSNQFKQNYFLHHILLGHYLDSKDSWPLYLNRQQKITLEDFNYINDSILNIKSLNKYQIISLSNVFDWMDDNMVRETLNFLYHKIEPGTHIVFRQLNNTKDYLSYNPSFKECDMLLEKKQMDKSLFYNKFNIIKKK